MWDCSAPFGVLDQIILWLGLYSIFFGNRWRSENALQREHHFHLFFLWLNYSCINSNKNSFNQFWRAGDYDVQNEEKWSLPVGMHHIQVHPKFLHSNATSHTWEFGDISKLLDNVVGYFQNFQNGATFFIVDKIHNPRDNSPTLLFQDNGGRMDLNCMWKCMILGY